MVGTARRLARRVALGAGTVLLAGGTLSACSSSSSGSASGNVLLVGTFNGKAGKYTTIQDAVSAAKSGDWILVAPGDYHENGDATLHSASDFTNGDHGGVVVRTSGIHIRGMNRDTVVVDGTKAGARTPCSSDPQYQNFGPVAGGNRRAATGSWSGRPTT